MFAAMQNGLEGGQVSILIRHSVQSCTAACEQ